jgi:very-short-patch-repair endonuclease
MNKEYRYLVRQMRINLTEAEKALWSLLRSRKLKDFKFRRQHPIGPYVADFCCLQKRIIIELDGTHHLAQKKEDQNRTDFLAEQGYSVIRFWNNQIEQEPSVVLDRILKTLESVNRRLTPARAKMYQWKSPLPMEGEGGVRVE